jgi:hypothetical protein
MVIHGKQDEEVNFHHGVGMHRAVPEASTAEILGGSPIEAIMILPEGQGKLSEYARRLRRFMDAMDEE